MKLLTFLFFVYTLLDIIHAAPQSAPPAVKNAIDSLLNPKKGPSALQKSCEKISRELKSFVFANLKQGTNFDKALKKNQTENELSSFISNFDKQQSIDAFILHSVVFLIKFPESKTYPERLWKLAAIVERHERKSENNLINKPFFSALVNACSLLPPDNTFNIEGRFLAARHYGRKGETDKQEQIVREILKRDKLNAEVYFTCLRELGLINELAENFDKALKLYEVTNQQIIEFPQYLDLRMRSIFIHLELSNIDEATKTIEETRKIPKTKRDLYTSNDILDEFLLLNNDNGELKNYWINSNQWWSHWLAFRKNNIPGKNLNHIRIPDVNKRLGFSNLLSKDIEKNNKIEFFSTLDLLLHGLRWSPSLLNEAGPALCFLLPQIIPNKEKEIHNLILSICKPISDKENQFNRRAKLYKSISYSSVKSHDEAIVTIREFLKNDKTSDEVTETIVRLWAHIAINENKDTIGPEAALIKLLSTERKLNNRAQTVLYLSQLFRKNEAYNKEKELLITETQNTDILKDKNSLQVFVLRLKELDRGIANDEELSNAFIEWGAEHSPTFLNFTLQDGLNDDRLLNENIEDLIFTPSQVKLSQEEALKLRLLVAQSQNFSRIIREQSFQQAFSEIYSSTFRYSSARKMLRSVVNDERFPLRLSQNILLLAMEDAMSRGEKRDIIYAITHPLMDRNAPRIQNLIQIYGRYADTDLDSSDSLKKCYKDVTNSINFPSSFGVIAKIFERSLELGDIDLAEEISLDSKNWKTPPALERRKEIISKALSQSLERSEENIVFAKEMRAIAIKYIKNIDRDNIFSSADYRKELNLKTLSEKNGYEWLAKRGLNKNTVESSPRFWFDLAEIMPRDDNQVDFSFALVETLLKSNINDLEKSFSVFSTPSIIDTDDLILRERLFKVLEKHDDLKTSPYTHAAIIITMTQSADIRDGKIVNINERWETLEHPILEDVRLSTKIGYFMARNMIPDLKNTLNSLSDEKLFSSEFIDVSVPALAFAGMKEKLNNALLVSANLMNQYLPKAVRTLDFQLIRFIYRYDELNTTNNKIPKNWFTSIDGQIKSERDSYSLRIMEAEHKGNWKSLTKWSGKAVAEYPTYYNYYRPRGIALYKIGKIESAIKALEVYIKFSKDESTWTETTELLKKLKFQNDPN
ncbi:hypothetical protein N8603_01585 [Verrucomicrobiales bacterium]|nr:hypothetical protein [Verrucomicrobiales bacterium]